MAKSMPLESFLFSTNYDVPEEEEVTEGRSILPSDCDNTLFLARINKRWNTINHAFPGMACNVYCAVSQRPPLLRTPVQLYDEHNLLEWKFNELQFHGHNFRVVYLLGNARRRLRALGPGERVNTSVGVLVVFWLRPLNLETHFHAPRILLKFKATRLM